jgi:hypothetical protein
VYTYIAFSGFSCIDDDGTLLFSSHPERDRSILENRKAMELVKKFIIDGFF